MLYECICVIAYTCLTSAVHNLRHTTYSVQQQSSPSRLMIHDVQAIWRKLDCYDLKKPTFIFLVSSFALEYIKRFRYSKHMNLHLKSITIFLDFFYNYEIWIKYLDMNKNLKHNFLEYYYAHHMSCHLCIKCNKLGNKHFCDILIN